MPFNSTAKNVMLDALDENPQAQITHVGIAQMSTDPGTGTNASGSEATGGSPAYARQAVVWGAASGALKSNTGALTFDVPAGTYGWFTLWNASSGNTNNYRGAIPFGGANALKGFFSVDTTLANDALLSVAHGMSDGDRVLIYPVFSEALPTASGLSAGTVLYVVNSTANSFKLSATLGGAALDITALGGGEGYWQRIIPETFNAQGQITVAAGALVLDLTGV